MKLYKTAVKGNNKVIRPIPGLSYSHGVNSTNRVLRYRSHLKAARNNSDIVAAASDVNSSANTNLLKTDNSKKGPNLKDNLVAACYLTAISTVGFTNTANADWFQVANITANLITPLYTLVIDNLGKVAFAVGGASTFFARGQDMWQKGIAFGIGSLGTAGAVKLAQTVLHLG